LWDNGIRNRKTKGNESIADEVSAISKDNDNRSI